MVQTSLIAVSSLVFQFLAVILAIRLIRVTGHKIAWILITIAIVIQFIRRLLSVLTALDKTIFVSLQRDEEIALLISFFTFLGVFWIGRFFSEIQHSKEILNIAKLQAENARAKTESIIAAIGNGIHIRDKDLHMIYQNDVSKLFFGDHKGEKGYCVSHQTDALRYSDPVQETFADGLIHSAELALPTLNGTSQFEITTSPLKNGHGELVAVIEVIRNIDQRKRKEKEREDLIMDLNIALSKVKILTGLISTCSGCKKIRNTHGEWEEMESFLKNHSDAKFSHGICPDCVKRFYPEIYDELSRSQKLK